MSEEYQKLSAERARSMAAEIRNLGARMEFLTSDGVENITSLVGEHIMLGGRWRKYADAFEAYANLQDNDSIAEKAVSLALWIALNDVTVRAALLNSIDGLTEAHLSTELDAVRELTSKEERQKVNDYGFGITEKGDDDTKIDGSADTTLDA